MKYSKPDNNTIDKFTEIEISACPAFIRKRLGLDTVSKLILDEVKLNMSYCDDDDFAKGFYDFSKIEGSEPNDYKFRQINTPLGEMVTSIRFIGGDLNKPAVFLIYKDFELNNLKDIRSIGDIVRKEYKVFQPQRFRWHSHQEADKLIQSNDSINGDMVYVAGFMEDLKQLSRPDNYDKVQLIPASSLSWYNNYKQTYLSLCDSWPAFIEMGQMESTETLLKLMDNGTLFEIIIDDEWAGIIAANTGTDNFFNGYFIVEEILSENYRGKHYASAVQRHLVKKLQHNKDDMLFGTIHYNNKPSLNTALRLGRKIVGIHIFSDIAY